MMARVSTIERLPDDIRSQLQELLRDPRVTQLDATEQINQILEAEGVEDRLSKSAVNRYAVRMNEVGEKLRQSRDVAEMWIGKLGAEPQGKMGNLINEMIRSLSFDVSLMLSEGELTEESLPGVIDMIKDLSLTTARLEKASSENVKREAEIRRQAREEIESKVDEAAKGKKTLTVDDFKAAVREVYGG